MREIKTNILRKILLGGVACVLIITSINWQTKTAYALTVSPVKIEKKVNPGDTFTETIILRNEQKESKTFYVDFQSFEARDESGNPTLLKSKFGLPSWMTSEVESVTLGVGEEKKLNIEVKVPQDAEAGGYFAAILLRSDPPRLAEEETAVVLGSQVGSLILLQVSGDLSEEGAILEFDTKSKKRFFKNLPVDFYFRFQNSGDTWTKPLGDIVIENLWGGTSAIIPANPEGGNILPRSIRKMERSWISKKTQEQDPLETSTETPSGFWENVKFQWKTAPVGRFTANLSLNYGAGNQLRATKAISFWILPWELLSVAVPSGILILTLSYLALKRYNRYIIEKDKKKRKKLSVKKGGKNE